MFGRYVLNQKRDSYILIENLDLLKIQEKGFNKFSLEYHEPSLVQFNNHILGEFDSISICLFEIYNIKNCNYGVYCISGFVDYKKSLLATSNTGGNMSSLYQLNEDYKTVLNMLYDEDIDEQMILDTLEGIEGEIEDKADAYAKIIKELEAKQKAGKEEAKRLSERSKMFDIRIKRLKQNLLETMKTVGKTKFATDLFSFNIVGNGGRQALTIDGDVPEEYTRSVIEADTEKIRQALESGEELSFAHLEPRGESLRIK